MPALLAAALPAAGQQRFSVMPHKAATSPAHLYFDKKMRVIGHFGFVPDSTGIETNRRGGARLVADMRAQGTSGQVCAKDTYCNPVVQRQPSRPDVPRFSVGGFEGYCLSEHEVPRSPRTLGEAARPRICWVRPGPRADYCKVMTQAALKARPTRRRPCQLGQAAAGSSAGACIPTSTHRRAPGIPPCSIRAATNKQTLDGRILTLAP